MGISLVVTSQEGTCAIFDSLGGDPVAKRVPTRSVIFGGDLTTTRTHFVTSTDLTTCDAIWQFRVDDTTEYSGEYGCCGFC